MSNLSEVNKFERKGMNRIEDSDSKAKRLSSKKGKGFLGQNAKMRARKIDLSKETI